MGDVRRLLRDIGTAVDWRVGRLAGKPPFWMSRWERYRLKRAPRLRRMTAPLLGKRIEITDPYWYLPTYDDIFANEIYKFTASSATPLIIDCGANIGLSVIYFKHLYPNAKIIAFEPDPGIVAVLERNIEKFALPNVELCRQAVWTSEVEMCFQPDGSVGGRLAKKGGAAPTVCVPGVRLRDFLAQPVDMLKIDIEGAEHEVLLDCADALQSVEHLFVEYHGRADEVQRLHDVLHILQNAGFRYHIREANPVAHPFLEAERSSFYDLQLNVFGFRTWGGTQ